MGSFHVLFESEVGAGANPSRTGFTSLVLFKICSFSRINSSDYEAAKKDDNLNFPKKRMIFFVINFQ